MAYERLKRKLTKENLWIYILRLLLDGPMYGYELRRQIEKRYGFKPNRVTCYVVLYSLKREGFIEERGETASKLGPPRTYYSITKKGRDLLQKAKTYIKEFEEKIF